MNFRQRIAWLLLAFYLVGTFLLLYYLFEGSSQYSMYAVEHSRVYHSSDKAQTNVNTSAFKQVWQHLSDIPFFVWVAVFSVPYLQVFCVLLLCTKSDPWTRFVACVVPVLGLFYICRQRKQTVITKLVQSQKPLHKDLSKLNGSSLTEAQTVNSFVR